LKCLYEGFKNLKNRENCLHFNAINPRCYNRIFTYSFYPLLCEASFEGFVVAL
jgi:hypothetical protein